MTRRTATRTESADPMGAIRPFVAPIVAIVVLAIVSIATFGLLTGDLRFVGVSSPNDGDGDGGIGPIGGGPATPAPSNVVIVDPRTEILGSIAYVKAGNLWIQSGTEARQVTEGGRDAGPAWSADGDWLYFVRTRPEQARWPIDGRERTFVMDVPALMRIHGDGSGLETVLDGLIKSGSRRWFFWIKQPAPSPDGTTVALITDGPDPSKSSVRLKLLDLPTGKLKQAGADETNGLGHQDPAWRADGKFLAVTRNSRDRPTISRYVPETDKASTITGPGYLQPSWSPDMRYLAVTKSTPVGTNVVILDARTGAEVLTLSDDGRSWAPTWSPAGDSITFFHRTGELVDLKVVELSGTGPAWRVEQVLNLTVVSDLDGSSRATWWIPPDQLPTPAPAPSAEPSGSGSSASPSQPPQP